LLFGIGWGELENAMSASGVFFKIEYLLSRLFTLAVKGEFDRLDRATIWWNVRLSNPSRIRIGRGVTVRSGSWLYAVVSDQQGHTFNPIIEIGDGVYLGHRLHLTAVNRVTIEEKAMIADTVYISDNVHEYRDVNLPIQEQAVISRGPLTIGAGSFIGEGARIVGSVRVGRNSVVGANAVVTKSIPDYVVAVGVPARIIRVYDHKSGSWRPAERQEGDRTP